MSHENEESKGDDGDDGDHGDQRNHGDDYFGYSLHLMSDGQFHEYMRFIEPKYCPECKECGMIKAYCDCWNRIAALQLERFCHKNA